MNTTHDHTKKKVGPVHSTSRAWERAMKKRTNKVRRRESRAECNP